VANGCDDPITTKNKMMPSWVPVLLALASLLFTSGQYYFKIQTMEAEIVSLRQDLVRKDVFQGQLQLLDYRMSSIQQSMERNEATMQQILKFIR
jgi:hypothetical protein